MSGQKNGSARVDAVPDGGRRTDVSGWVYLLCISSPCEPYDPGARNAGIETHCVPSITFIPLFLTT